MPNLPITAKINSKGHLEIGGCDAVELAEQFGTPLYVMDEATLRFQSAEYKKNFAGFEIVYASKALSVIGILKILKEEGLSLDVSSGGELYTALKAGFDPKKIYFHGNNKSEAEISEAIAAGIGYFMVDSLYELNLLDKLAGERSQKAAIIFRVNPKIDAHTHAYIQTGKIDSKFGIQFKDVIAAVKAAKHKNNILFEGLHAHIGSQILDAGAFAALTRRLVSLCLPINILSLGGGIGIQYTKKDRLKPLSEFSRKIMTELKKSKIKIPKITLEPGRSIVGRAGVTLYTVGAIKDIPGVRKYAALDGGMADNPRPILYQARYEALAANKAKAKSTQIVTLAGRFCESGDVLMHDIRLPHLESGDIIAVACTGAYNYSMASNYNRVPRPAMVVVDEGKARLVLRRESYEDLVKNDL
jgi:diaminopimelate decarboxylase